MPDEILYKNHRTILSGPKNSHVGNGVLCARKSQLITYSAALIFFLSAELACAETSSISSRISGDNFTRRSEAFIRYLASAKPANPRFPKEAAAYYAARLQLGADVPGTLKAIDVMLDATLKAKPDPFNLHAVMHTYLQHRDNFTPVMTVKVKRLAASWSYSKPIGVSMNYELMRDGSGLLAAQEWPDLVDHDGNNAEKISKNCSDWLWRIWRETTERNASEYDAPIYYGTDFAPTRMIAEFARDDKMSNAARLTLDFMLIQTGAHWLHGYHISTAGRGKYWGSLNLGPDSAAPTNGMAFLWFGADRPFNLASAPQTYWLAHPGRALPGDWLSEWQKSLPDDRTVLANQLWPGHKIYVRKMAWFTKSYGLASQREDGTSADNYLFKECRRTMLKWVSDKPGSSFTVCQENRRRPQEKIANAFAYGENPHAQVLQHEGTLIGVYDVPKEYGFWKTTAPFTTTGAIIKRIERDGWVFCHGGTMLFAFRFTKPAQFLKGKDGIDLITHGRDQVARYECGAQRGGWILETSSLSPFAGGDIDEELEKFASAIAAKTKISGDTTANSPHLIFKNLAGHTLDLKWHPIGEPYQNQCLLDGKPVDYSNYPLLGGPNVHQPNGGPLTLTIGNKKRVYDFKKWTARTTSE